MLFKTKLGHGLWTTKVVWIYHQTLMRRGEYSGERMMFWILLEFFLLCTIVCPKWDLLSDGFQLLHSPYLLSPTSIMSI